jgi:hypothetical protein
VYGRTCKGCAKPLAYKGGPEPKWCGRRCRNLFERYRLTLIEVEDMLSRQSGSCAICDKLLGFDVDGVEVPHVDHDHSSGEVRGILCRSCNTGIGKLGDNPYRLERARRYLTRSCDQPERDWL